MGATQSLVSSEAAVVTVIVAGAVGYGYTQLAGTNGTRGAGEASSSTSGLTGNAEEEEEKGKGKSREKEKGKGKKNKKQTAMSDMTGATTATTVTATVTGAQVQFGQMTDVTPVLFSEVIPGSFDTARSSDVDAGAGGGAIGTAGEPSKSKKPKKKSKKQAASASASSSKVLPPPSVESSAVLSSSSVVVPAQASKDKDKEAQPSIPSSSSPARTIQPPPAIVIPPPSTAQQADSITSHDTDSSWTHVRSRRRDEAGRAANLARPMSGLSADFTTSDTGIASSMTDDGEGDASVGASSPVVGRTEDEEEGEGEALGSGPSYVRETGEGTQRRPLAERLLPKPRKTGVDDMLETSDYPAVSRVMRVHPLPGEKPASGFSWADYEDVHVEEGAGHDADGEDDGWGVVKSRRSRPERSSTTGTAAATTSKPQSEKAPETLTKRQRQNAKKREAAKSAKADTEGQRLATLAKHKQQLEKTKMIEQLAGKGGGKSASGGMKASVDDNGKLVWE
ncbi:hypothetical protein AX17_007194 [Amanita inopinata Kibby_2008]|nr:hypothetical protein AX17_007194 [Amanita inopinata Kibby_2008]